MKSFVLAANFQHATLVAGWLGLNQWIYPSDPTSLYRCREATIYIYETANWRKDWNQICDILASRDFNIVPIDKGFSLGVNNNEII